MSLGGSAPGPTLMAAIGRAVNAGIIIVISAGNDGALPQGVNPDPFALTPAQSYPGMVIIAGSVGVSNGAGGTNINQISTFSNRAGAGAQYYLMALGYRDRAPDETGTEWLWSGTSFSAPTITGAVALLAQAFPNLTGSQIANILFQSADDLGASRHRFDLRPRASQHRPCVPADRSDQPGRQPDRRSAPSRTGTCRRLPVTR